MRRIPERLGVLISYNINVPVLREKYDATTAMELCFKTSFSIQPFFIFKDTPEISLLTEHPFFHRYSTENSCQRSQDGAHNLLFIV